MINIEDKTKCCGCHACFNICPKNAITMEEDEKGFKYPIINKEKCVDCGLCEKVCPIINKKEKQASQKAYACYNKDEKVRLESSSGGVFSLIANYILENNGVVFGAAFDNEFKVKHILVDKKEDLYKLRTSKYVQSSINDTYRKAKEYLEKNVKVLFTGTPCQVNGLLTFLGKEYENLYTQDIICHGVPSPKVWEKYLKYRKKKDENEKIEDVNFRKKDNGWGKYEFSIKYSNKEVAIDHNKDIYMNAFLRDVSLRDSCYKCSFKDKIRKTDITLADFWGINNIKPEMNDDKGTSLIFVNSNKGNELLEKIKNNLVIDEVNFEESIQYNKSMYISSSQNKSRDKFFENLDKLEFDELVKKYAPVKKVSLARRILRKCKRIAKKVLKRS